MNAKVAAKKRAAGGAAAPQEGSEEPNATIFVENLPNEANESMLNLLFSQFPGFKKRSVKPAYFSNLEILIRFEIIFKSILKLKGKMLP